MKNTKKLKAVANPGPQAPAEIVGKITITKDAAGVMKLELAGDQNIVTGLSLVEYARIWLEAKCLQAIIAGEQQAAQQTPVPR